MRLETNRNCPACGAPIAYIQSAVSRAIQCLDPEPVDNGNVVIRDGVAVALKKAELFDADGQPKEGEPRYISHFATCTDPKRFRRSAK